MSHKLKPISDPEEKNSKEKTNEFPSKMKMRSIQPSEGKPDGKSVNVKSTPNMVSEDKVKGLQPLCPNDRIVNTIKVAEKVLDLIESVDNHNGFTIGRDHKQYCGHTIQRIPMGGFARIGGGKSIFYADPPLVREPKLVFKFDRSRQLAFKVGNNVGKDWVVLVAANGCVYFDTGSFASFHMPVYVVEQTGDYYSVNSGNRILLLGSGHHLILYTNEAPILFVRKNTITHKRSIPPTSQPLPITLPSKEELKKKEPPNKHKPKEEEPQKEQQLKKKEEIKKVEPKISVEDVIKPKPKVKEQTIGPVVPPPVNVPAKPTEPTDLQTGQTRATGQTTCNPYYIGILFLILMAIICLLFWKTQSSKKSCKVCKTKNIK